MSNIITIQKANVKSSVRQHGPSANAKVGSGAAEEKTLFADRSYRP
jgi:hypothetical protein